MICIKNICKKVLTRLAKMDYEMNCRNSHEKLIFPNKIQSKGNMKRISEQELRILFIDEIKNIKNNFYYSIETPTENKYKFGKTLKDIVFDRNGRSALIDMCIFKSEVNNYRRLLNIEFKHKNSNLKDIAKDILKLICEPQNGVFVQLLDNTNKGTLCNNRNTGVFNKLYKSFSNYKENWINNDKSIQIIILSLKQQILVYQKISKNDICNLENIFFTVNGCGNISQINEENGWKTEKL